MAKLKGPLMSMTASGNIGSRMTFSMRKTGAQVRIQRAQKDKITPARIIQRGLYSDAIAIWKNYTNEQKDIYNMRAENLRMTGYNLFLKETLLSPVVSDTISLYGLRVYGLSLYGSEV